MMINLVYLCLCSKIAHKNAAQMSGHKYFFNNEEKTRRVSRVMAVEHQSGDRFSEVTRLIRMKLSFIILKSALQCIRGSRTVYVTTLVTT